MWAGEIQSRQSVHMSSLVRSCCFRFVSVVLLVLFFFLLCVSFFSVVCAVVCASVCVSVDTTLTDTAP